MLREALPGHGDTALDSHLARPVLAHDLERLLEIELPPSAAAIEAGVASVMSAHVVFEAIDPHGPATFSPDVVALLRERLGFDGLVFSDDLEMKAVADRWQPHEMVDLALGAGIERALVRIAAFERRFASHGDDTSGPPDPEHLALAARLTRDA